MTLRRSSRAPPPAHSNSSSSLSSRDRTTRSNNKASSPHKSASPASLSSEEGDDTARHRHGEEPHTRRRTRAQDIEEDEAAKMDEDLDEEVGDDEEETTRCICGYQEYPGPPSDDEHLAVGSDLQAEDVGGLFIQCDKCKVWQHGGCVGIMEEKAVPENYFCEECRKDLHKLLSSPKGQKYSHYIPVVGDKQPPKADVRKGSTSKEHESKGPRDKDKSRASVEAHTKRRSTMNSRAAYDDDEVLRKVIEESKGDGGAAEPETNSRKGKRTRDESEDAKQGIKRQRTGSGSSSSPAPSEMAESEEEGRSKSNSTSQKQKPRGAAARSQQERLLREQKEREKERADSVGKRKGRAERRRAEESIEAAPVGEVREETDQHESENPINQTRDNTSSAPPPPSRKGNRAGGPRRGGNRVGRNQYTRDRDNPANDKAASPHRTGSRGLGDKGDEESHANGAEASANGSGSDAPIAARGHRSKKSGLSKIDKISWKDMNGTASHMLEYISRVQVEMASEKTNTTSSAMAVVKTFQVMNGESGSGSDGNASGDASKAVPTSNGKEEDYDGLNSLEMMDVLTRNLVLWQQSFGEHRDK
ncbi:hypothetical protein IWX90DRAFT_54381 [Phyllosticta citrichinensis]|uniref:Zinc finger PHD-type domain-containing protein n=1 Tax=Phyllosticta citrichinensis TaxID=1130410 RepID=A0ABR1XIH6_9PEZI